MLEINPAAASLDHISRLATEHQMMAGTLKMIWEHCENLTGGDWAGVKATIDQVEATE